MLKNKDIQLYIYIYIYIYIKKTNSNSNTSSIKDLINISHVTKKKLTLVKKEKK
jgi:hypothetical protein